MAKPRKPPPIFELLFEGPGIYPEAIPLGTLTQTLSAIRRLAIGAGVSEDEEEEEAETTDGGLIRLLDVVRGSAVFRFAGPAGPLPGAQSPKAAVERLRLAGRVIKNPDEVGENDYVLRPIERLSATARRLDCSIIVREPGPESAILARIEPGSFEHISKRLFISGDTSFTGTVQRVGGATEMRCALRVSFQNRLLFCRVAGVDVARKLGDRLYKEVTVQGTAQWLKSSWRIVAFVINEVRPLKQGSINEAIEAIREAGGKGWDQIEDPDAYLERVIGK
jgi:hypothetical protein